MTLDFEVRHLRVWWHCGWAVTVDPGLDGEICDNGRTLRLFDEPREFSLTSNHFARNDGVPFRAEDVFEWFPPADMAGERFAHEDAEHIGRALWVTVPPDGPKRTWLLVAITLHRASQRGAQMTTVVHSAEAKPWALATWRGVRYDPDEAARTTGPAPTDDDDDDDSPIG